MLARIGGSLIKVRSGRGKLVMVNIHLPDIMDFDAMHAVCDQWWMPSSAPARATVETRLADPALRVEISVIVEI